jgi:hypothetical protein
MQFDNGAVDPGGQPEIVGIEDKTAHRVSVSTPGAATCDRSDVPAVSVEMP